MAWHKYRKLSASPSLTVGLNLPTYLCRDDTKDLIMSILVLSNITTTHVLNISHTAQQQLWVGQVLVISPYSTRPNL